MTSELVINLRDYLLERLGELPASERLLVGIAGIPGSGKTTLAFRLTAALNDDKNQDQALCVPMDGWHYSRAILDTFPDPKEAHRRRGAAFTFNAAAFVEYLKSIRRPIQLDSAPIFAPSFDHATKDPEADAIGVEAAHRIIILEGLYLLLDQDPWSKAAGLLDERWLVEVPRDVARKRLIKRHVETGVAADAEAAAFRADDSDLVNGDEILARLLEPTRRIPYTVDKMLTVQR